MALTKRKFGKRADGRIAVILDNNAWDFLYERQLDLSVELPNSEFAIHIPREVEIEKDAIPSGAKKDLKEFINRTIVASQINTTSVFGFSSQDSSKPIRVGGFGQGTFQSQNERDFYTKLRVLGLLKTKEKRSQLTDNEADAAVGAQSFSSIVLTCEARDKQGPLKVAEQLGGAILRLTDFDASGLTLRNYVLTFYKGF